MPFFSVHESSRRPRTSSPNAAAVFVIQKNLLLGNSKASCASYSSREIAPAKGFRLNSIRDDKTCAILPFLFSRSPCVRYASKHHRHSKPFISLFFLVCVAAWDRSGLFSCTRVLKTPVHVWSNTAAFFTLQDLEGFRTPRHSFFGILFDKSLSLKIE